MKKLVAVLASIFLLVGLLMPTSTVAATNVSTFAGYMHVDEKKPRNPGANGKHKGNDNPKARGKIKPRPTISPRRSSAPDGRPSVSPYRQTQPRPVNITVKCGPTTVSAGQGRVICVTIEQPVETHTIYKTRTKTKTEKVLQGAGVLAVVAVGAGLLALFLGYILGWRGAGKNEEKFYSSLLDNDNK